MPPFYYILLFTLLRPVYSQELSTIDKYQQYASAQLVGISNSVDYFFGGIRVDEESNGTFGRLTLLTQVIQDESIKAKPSFRLRIELPGTKKRLKLVFDDGNEETTSAARGSRVNSITQKNERDTEGLNAAVRFIVQQKVDWNVNFDTGLKIRIGSPLDPFLRLRARRSFYFGNWQLRGVQEFYEYLRRSTVSQTVVDFDYPMGDGFLFRFGNGAKWTNELDYFTFSTGFSLFQKLDDKRALSYNAIASGNNEFNSTFTSYDFFLTYRTLLYKHWFFMEITPGVQYPKIKDFDQTLFAFIEFQALIGNFK